MCKKQRKPSRTLAVSNLTKKRVSGFLAGVLLMGGFLTPTYRAEAHTGYFLSILPDINTLSYQALIVDDGPRVEKDHLEFDFLGGSNVIGPSGSLTSIPTTIEEFTTKKDELQKVKKTDGVETKCMFTFPTCSTTGSLWNATTDFFGSFSDNGDGTNEDREAAARVGRELTTGANDALSYILNTLEIKENGTYKKYSGFSGDEKEAAFFELTGTFANKANNVGREEEPKPFDEFTYKGNTYTITPLSTDDRKENGLDSTSKKENTYLRIKHSKDSGKGAIFLYSTPRYPGVSTAIADAKSATTFINLFQIIALGNASYVYKGVTTTSVEAVFKPSFVENFVIGILNNLLQGLRNFMGLNTMGELMFNEGSYGANSYKGIAPVSWFQAADVIFWVSQVFAWLLLAFASLKFLGMHMWSTITPMNRVSLMNGIQNILITAFLLSMIVPIFNVVAQFNFLIVGVLRDSSTFNDNILTGQLFPGTLAGIVLAFLFFMSELVINFIYILRGATVCLLYGLSPVFVVAFAFGGRFQSITLKFVKELIGNIFIQTFHAVILTFYGLFIFTGSSGNFFVNLVMVFAFIPMTKVFKEITGIGESGFIQGVAEQAKGVVQSKTMDTFKGATGSLSRGEEQAYHNNRKSDNRLDSETNHSQLTTSDGFTTSTYRSEKEKGVLNSPENDRSIGDSMTDNGLKKNHGPSNPETSTATIPNDPTSSNNATLGSGGGTVNEFGKANFNSGSGTSQRKMLFNAAKGVTGLAGGAALGALGGFTGSRTLQKYANRMAAGGFNGMNALGGDLSQAAKNTLANVTEHFKDKSVHLDRKFCDYDFNKNPSSELHTYSGRNAEKLSDITDTHAEMIDDKQCLVQEFSKDAAIMNDLKNIQFDPTTGRVTDEEALKRGITHISKTDEGHYRVALDMQKSGIKECRSVGNGSRLYIKTEVGKGCDDMNYVAKALEGYQPATPTSSSSDSTSKVS